MIFEQKLDFEKNSILSKNSIFEQKLDFEKKF